MDLMVQVPFRQWKGTSLQTDQERVEQVVLAIWVRSWQEKWSVEFELHGQGSR